MVEVNQNEKLVFYFFVFKKISKFMHTIFLPLIRATEFIYLLTIDLFRERKIIIVKRNQFIFFPRRDDKSKRLQY